MNIEGLCRAQADFFAFTETVGSAWNTWHNLLIYNDTVRFEHKIIMLHTKFEGLRGRWNLIPEFSPNIHKRLITHLL